VAQNQFARRKSRPFFTAPLIHAPLKTLETTLMHFLQDGSPARAMKKYQNLNELHFFMRKNN
jgi:hypothetical protein